MTSRLVFTRPSANAITDMVRSNAVLPNLNQDSETFALLTDAEAGVTENLASIQSSMDGLLASAQTIESSLQAEIQSALNTLATAPDSFMAQINNIQASFPTADLQPILDKISSGDLDIATDIPNLQNIAGQTIERAAAEIKPNLPPVSLPQFPTIPEITLPDVIQPVMQDISNLRVNSNNAISFGSVLEETQHRLATLATLNSRQ